MSVPRQAAGRITVELSKNLAHLRARNGDGPCEAVDQAQAVVRILDDLLQAITPWLKGR